MYNVQGGPKKLTRHFDLCAREHFKNASASIKADTLNL